MAHFVTCRFCKERFDRDKEPFIKIAERQYIHAKCQGEGKFSVKQMTEEQDKDKFFQYFKTLYPNYNFPKNDKLAKKYIEEYHFTYSGMLGALKWFYEIEKNPIGDDDTIGIIPYIYEQAKRYYLNLYAKQRILENTPKEYLKPKVREVVIESPEVYRKPLKLFFEGEED